MPAAGSANTTMFKKFVLSNVLPAHAITLTSMQNTIVAATTTRFDHGCEIAMRFRNPWTNTTAKGMHSTIASAIVTALTPQIVGTVTPNANTTAEVHATTFAIRCVTATLSFRRFGFG